MALQGFVSVQLQALYDSAIDLGIPTAFLNVVKNLPFTNGAGVDQANKVWWDTRTIAAAETLDFAGGVTDAFGVVLTFAGIKAFWLEAAAANTTNVIIGATVATQHLLGFGAATNQWSVPPGQIFLATNLSAAGWAVAAGSTDLLRIAPSSGTVTYNVAVLGD